MDTSQQLDPSIVALTKAIGHQESGGDYTKTGDNGHSAGAYQWNNSAPLKQGEVPENFKSYATEVGADPTDFSPANQDKVAYETVKKWGTPISQGGLGLSPAEIASKWNSGDPQAYKTKKPGYNVAEGVNYDTSSYVNNVSKYYEQYLGESPEKTLSEQVKPQASQPNDLLNNPVTRGIETFGNILTGGGAGQLGEQVGTSLATIGEKAKGLLGGQDNSKYIAPPDVNQALLGGLKTGIGAASIASGAKGIQNLLKTQSVLESPAVANALKDFDLPMEQFKNLGAADKLEYLTQALPNAGAADKVVLQQAIKEISPAAIKEAGGIVSFAEKYPKIAKLLTLGKYAIGGTLLGGAINKGEKLLGLLK